MNGEKKRPPPTLAFSEQLNDVLNSVRAMTDALRDDVRMTTTTVALMKARLDDAVTEIEAISRVLRTGNGGDSVVTKIALLREDVKRLDKAHAQGFRRWWELGLVLLPGALALLWVALRAGHVAP